MDHTSSQRGAVHDFVDRVDELGRLEEVLASPVTPHACRVLVWNGREEALSAAHPNIGHALHLQAAFWIRNNRRKPEAIAQLQRALAMLDHSFGDQHDWTKRAREDVEKLRGRVTLT